jgi:hypothetical protein
VHVVPVISMTTGLPAGEGGAVTVTRIDAASSPFSFWASTLQSIIQLLLLFSFSELKKKL